MSLINNYANFAQLVLADKDGIAYAGEVWKEGKNAVFKIPRINYSNTHFFLLLMGHWDKGKAANPTLLASGFTPLDPKTGHRKILVYMWPIQAQAELTSKLGKPTKADGTDNTNEPMTYIAAERVSELWPAESSIEWTLKTEGEGDPLAPLIAAQELLAALKTPEASIPDKAPAEGVWDDDYSSAKKPLKVAKGLIKTKGKNTADDTSLAGTHDLPTNEGGVSRVITWDMSEYTAGLEDQFNEGSVNFNLEYVPFNLTDGAVWKKWGGDSNFSLDGKGLPVWIIRSGLNDEAQDGNTKFDDLDTGSNGNGAAAFRVKHRYWMGYSGGDGTCVECYFLHADNPGRGWSVLADSPFVEREFFRMWMGKTALKDTLDRLEVYPVWDDYEQREVDNSTVLGLLEWEIDWPPDDMSTDEWSDLRSGIYNDVTKAAVKASTYMTAKTLTIVRDAVSGKQRLNVPDEFSDTLAEDEYYQVRLRGTLKKGHKAQYVENAQYDGNFWWRTSHVEVGPRTFTDGQDFTGGIIFLLD
jgi:hypothetical protein